MAAFCCICINCYNWIVRSFELAYAKEMILLLLLASSINPLSWAAIDKFSFILFAMTWLVTVYVSVHYYQKGFVNKKNMVIFLVYNGSTSYYIIFDSYFTYVSRKRALQCYSYDIRRDNWNCLYCIIYLY